jgi:hypothetical protein
VEVLPLFSSVASCGGCCVPVELWCGRSSLYSVAGGFFLLWGYRFVGWCSLVCGGVLLPGFVIGVWLRMSLLCILVAFAVFSSSFSEVGLVGVFLLSLLVLRGPLFFGLCTLFPPLASFVRLALSELNNICRFKNKNKN